MWPILVSDVGSDDKGIHSVYKYLHVERGMDLFEEVKLEQAFLEPDGFYTHVNKNKCKVVLLRLPKDYDLSRLEGQVIKAPSNKSKTKNNRKKGTPLGDDADHELFRANEQNSAGLLMPGAKGLKVQKMEETWAVVAKGPQVADKVLLEEQELSFDRDVIVKAKARKQPEDLGMNLSAVDMSSVIDIKKKYRHKHNSTQVQDPSSPPKRVKKSKTKHN